MNKLFFSVVIPTLNEEKFLPRLLTDLSKQKERSFEVIIVDGQSTDSTKKVAEQFKKKLPNFSFLTSKKRNLCFQRNFGAEHAKGEYLVFMDADVQVFTNYLSEIRAHIEETSAAFVTTYQLPDVRSKFDIFLVQLANYTLELLSLINRQMSPGYNFIIKKEVFNKAGKFDLNATFSEDHDLSIRIYNEGYKISILKKRLLKWSFRRLKKNGRLPVIYKYSLATIYMLVSDNITDKSFSYPMGGSYFNEIMNHKNKDLKDEFGRYLRKIKNAFKRLVFDL